MIISIHPNNPEGRKINQLIDFLNKDGVLIVPTDSVYALVCNMTNQRAVDQICRLRELNPVKANLTFLCDTISRISQFTAPIPNDYFRLIKRNTPGPFTFILNSNQHVPKLFKNKKRTIGTRIPDNIFIQQLIQAIDGPLMSASFKLPGEDFHENDLEEISRDWEKRVSAIVDCGVVPNQETSIIDLTQKEMQIVRDGYQQLTL